MFEVSVEAAERQRSESGQRARRLQATAHDSVASSAPLLNGWRGRARGSAARRRLTYWRGLLRHDSVQRLLDLRFVVGRLQPGFDHLRDRFKEAAVLPKRSSIVETNGCGDLRLHL